MYTHEHIDFDLPYLELLPMHTPILLKKLSEFFVTDVSTSFIFLSQTENVAV